MPSFLATATILATASLAIAAPTAQPKKKGGFSVSRFPTGHHNSPAARRFHHEAKYGRHHAVKRQGEVEASPNSATSYDLEWLCPVTVGQTQMMLDFDTGSSDLWVFSTDMSDSSNHVTYNTSSGQATGQTWSIGYGDGSSAGGNVYIDTVTVGGVSVSGQDVEAATSVSSSFAADGASDGLLGLGFDNGNTCTPSQCQTFFGNLAPSLPQAVFAVDLQEGGGTYDFGYIDDNKYSSDITYTPVLQQGNGWWDFTAGSSDIDGNDVGYSIMDTGSTDLMFPSATVSSYYGIIDGASQRGSTWIVPCGSTLNDVNINIAGTDFTVPGSALMDQPLDSTGVMCGTFLQASSQTTANGANMSIFGDAFMKNFFVVFDYGNTQLGIATQS